MNEEISRRLKQITHTGENKMEDTTTPALDLLAPLTTEPAPAPKNRRARRTPEAIEEERKQRLEENLASQRRIAVEVASNVTDLAVKASDARSSERIAEVLGMSIAEFVKAHPISTSATSIFNRDQFMVEEDHDFYIPPDMRRRFEHYDSIAKAGNQVHVLFAGPTGCGKTESSLQLAARTKRPVFTADCANRREPRDWFGRRGARSGSTVWEQTAFIEAVEAGGFVILLEEMNRAPANVLNGIFGLLDRRKGAFIEEAGRKINVGANTIWLATLNEGAEYSGTFSTDAAIRSRFSRRIEVSWIPKAEEQKLLMKRVPGLSPDDAERLAEVAATVRNKSRSSFSAGSKISKGISTRQLIDAAIDLNTLGVEGLRDCIISHYDDDGADTERKEVMAIFQGKWPSLK